MLFPELWLLHGDSQRQRPEYALPRTLALIWRFSNAEARICSFENFGSYMEISKRRGKNVLVRELWLLHGDFQTQRQEYALPRTLALTWRFPNAEARICSFENFGSYMKIIKRRDPSSVPE
jgi:hypothetical protein